MLAKVISKVVAVTCLIICSSVLSTSWVYAEDSLAERIAPIGSTCLKGEACANAVAAAPSGGRTAESIYNTSCMACHATGAAGAPKLGDAAGWQARIDRGIETIYQNAIKGINATPPRGTCMDCTDDEIKAIVDYMLDSLK